MKVFVLAAMLATVAASPLASPLAYTQLDVAPISSEGSEYAIIKPYPAYRSAYKAIVPLDSDVFASKRFYNNYDSEFIPSGRNIAVIPFGSDHLSNRAITTFPVESDFFPTRKLKFAAVPVNSDFFSSNKYVVPVPLERNYLSRRVAAVPLSSLDSDYVPLESDLLGSRKVVLGVAAAPAHQELATASSL